MHVPLTHEPLGAYFGALCPDKTPGFAWSILDGSGRKSGGWGGQAAVDPEIVPVEEGTLFDLASLTKPLATALLALQAEDRGELDLDSPVPGTAGVPFTCLQILRHEAGFPAWVPLYAFAQDRAAAKRWLLESCPRGVPGEKTEYSCPGYVLLGFILEEVLHGSIDRLFADRVASPLGARPEEVCFAPAADLRRRTAATERGNFHEATMARQFGAPPPFVEPSGWGQVNDGNARFLGGAAGNAGLFATLGGVERLVSALRPSSGFLSDRALDRAWRPSAGFRTAGWKAAGHPGWAAGAVLPPGSVGHEGFTGTGVWMEPGEGMSYILLTNRIHPRHPGTDFGEARAAFLKAARGTS